MLAIIHAARINILVEKYAFICLTHISKIIHAPKKEGASTSLGEGEENKCMSMSSTENNLL